MKEVYGTMALDTKDFYTTEDIEALPEGVRVELLDGHIYYMAPPSITHQRILRDLSFLFCSYQRDKKGKCETFFAPCGVYISDKYNYLEPDLLIICPRGEEDRRIQSKGIVGAPDFVLEIVSPTNKYHDYYLKTSKYQAYGVREYWIVDPAKKKVIVYFFEKNELPTIYTFDDIVPVNIYDDLSINFKELDYLS